MSFGPIKYCETQRLQGTIKSTWIEVSFGIDQQFALLINN